MMFKKNYLDELPDDIYKAIYKRVFDKTIRDIDENTAFYDALANRMQNGRMVANFDIWGFQNWDFSSYVNMKSYTEIMPYGFINTISLPLCSYLLGGKKQVRRFNNRLKRCLIVDTEDHYDIMIGLDKTVKSFRIKDDYIYIELDFYMRCRADLFLCINDAFAWVGRNIRFIGLNLDNDGDDFKYIQNMRCLVNAWESHCAFDNFAMNVFYNSEGCIRTICDCVRSFED